ncbi:S-layer homology domain-containing protein [Paenibacillus silviterrae]|uniref:S-layer homology domain-containing protein n=1 Tax=Paenibacillus silviterrae TaxID=3242194 RepID=UPI002543F2AD|nr:S-layer homology domain-containing protein [Paenibacillus chinjuensis]
MSRKMLKKAVSTIAAMSLVVGTLFPSVPSLASAAPAADTAAHWAAKEIGLWMDLELSQGYEDGSFRPDAPISRAEFIALVNRVFDLRTSAAPAFSDVRGTDWFYSEIGRAVSAGYISGYEDGTIKPAQTITRQEVAVAVSKLVKATAADKPAEFKDASEFPAWSKEAIQALTAAGYLNGYPDQTFRPQQSITRAEALITLNKANAFTREMKAFDKAGTYQGDVKGHVVVQSPDVKLENMTIDGNLVLAASIGEGEALLKKVTVKGKTLVKGGGPNSITLEDSKLGEVSVNKANGDVRLVANGSTTVQSVEVNSGVKLEGNSKDGYGSVQVSKDIPSGSSVQVAGNVQSLIVSGASATVTLKDGSIREMKLEANSTIKVEGGIIESFVINSNAGQAKIDLGANAVVKSMTVDSNVQVTGSGTIGSAKINKSGADLGVTPLKTEISEGVQAKVGGKDVTSTNPGNSGSTPSAGSSNGNNNGNGSSNSDDNGPSDSGEQNRTPEPPAQLAATTGHQYVTLSWTAPNDSEVAGYNAYLDGQKINDALITKTKFTRIGLTNGQKYSFDVTSVSSRGKESRKTTVEATPVLTGNIPVQLLSINDLHGKIDQTYTETVPGYSEKVKIGRIDYTAAYLRQREETNPYTLMVEPGDLWGGSSPVSALLQDEPTIEIFEALGMDVGTLGNHEFDEGTQEMLRMVNGGEHPRGTKGYNGISFPIVAANVKYEATNQHVLPPYIVKEVAGVKIGFIGIVTEATPGIVIPEGITDIKFTNAREAVNESVAELKQQGVKAIVVLAHLDATQEASGTISGPAAELANAVDDEVDVIFAAHNHKIVNGTVDNKLIVQAYEYGKAIVDVDLQIDPATHDIVSKQGEIVYAVQDAITPDAEIAAILTKYEQAVASKINEVVGHATTPILRGENGTSGYVNQGDHPLGNLIADGMKHAMGADFALMNGGGIRDNLAEAGDITWGELFNIQPFNNVLVKFTVTGAELEQIMNSQISQYGADYSIAGFKYKWDRTTSKVVEMKLLNDQPIYPAQEYTLVVNNYMFGANKTIVAMNKMAITGPEDLEATVNYVRSFERPISAADFPLGRVVKLEGTSTDAGKKSIAEARALAAGSTVTIEGIAISQSGGWGSKGFYIQDATGGAYVYQSAADVVPGDKLRFTATTGSFNGEFQFAPDSNGIAKIGSEAVPAPVIIEPNGVTVSNQGTLVKLIGVTIADLTKFSYDTFEFNAVKDAVYSRVRVDNRTGLSYNNFTFKNGNVVNVTGVASVFNSLFQVKPRGVADIVPVNMTDADAVAMDKAALAIGYGSGDSATNVTAKLTLPVSGSNGTAVAWASNDPAISTSGSVTRPAEGQADKQVTLTATITKGTASDTKTFMVTVKAEISTTTPITIADARTRVNSTVMIEGIVTADNSALGGTKLSTYMQDETGAINIFKSNMTGIPDLKEGDRVRAKGVIKLYSNLTEIEVTEVTVLSSGNALPAAKPTSIANLQNAATAESMEGQLVSLKVYIGTTSVTAVGGGYNVPVIDGDFNTLTMRVMEGTNVYPALQSRKWYDVTAIVNQYGSDYQLIPRKVTDLSLSAAQPAIPATVDSTISSVVDGDTVHLSTKYIGTDTIRFVNIDTPETYHITNASFDYSQVYSGSDETSMNNNQKAHGERAKLYLKSLLPVGEAVTLKFGPELMDGNGRILGEIIRKSDNTNINLEMVKQGQASTYYIWPIDEVGYNTFSEAEKEAIRFERGIWNPADPATELPFVFRAREQKKGLSRPTGNRETKTYVPAEDYAQVPVEYRVFFNSEEEAQRNGYTAAAGKTPIGDLAKTASGNTTVDLSFTAPAGATSVKIQQSSNNGTVYYDSQTAATLTAASTTAQVVGLETGTNYKFKLVVQGGNSAGYSNAVDAATNVVAGPISNFNAVGSTYSTVDFSFRAPTDASVVKVTYSIDGGSTYLDAVTAAPLTAASTYATAKQLAASTAYKFRLDITGGPYAGTSNIVDVTTSAAPVTPITTMAVTGKTSSSITLGFPAPTGATVVKMTYSADNGTSWLDAPLVLNASSVTAQVYGLNAGTFYKFKLVVTGGQYEGESNIVSQTTDGVPGSSTELFFSEYLINGGSNKALEIYNGTSGSIDLSKYTVVQYNNGSTTVGSYKLTLSGTLAPGSVYVIVNNSAADKATMNANLLSTSSVMGFNGDDAIALYKNFVSDSNTGVLVDLIGKIGFDPGTAWTSGTLSTSTPTKLIRKASINKGVEANPADFDPSLEWIGGTSSDYTTLGNK